MLNSLFNLELRGYNVPMEQDKHRLMTSLEHHGIFSKAVLQAMGNVPRELFIPPEERSLAYFDHPLPIGCGQTVSQPFTVAFMAQLLDIKPGHTVLEIGAGSGYNAAVLQEITGPSGKVYSIERIPELVLRAQENLHHAAYPDVTVVQGDGKEGLAEHAPFDRIMVTAQGPHIPPPLIYQLKIGGILVMPVSSHGSASMTCLVKHEKEPHSISTHGAFYFVPLL